MAIRMDVIPRSDAAALSDLLENLRGKRTQSQVARMAGVDTTVVRYLEGCPRAPLATTRSRDNLSKVVAALVSANGANGDEVRSQINRLAGGV